jgi:hypothetical protein
MRRVCNKEGFCKMCAEAAQAQTAAEVRDQAEYEANCTVPEADTQAAGSESNFEVVVENIGSVYKGSDEMQARSDFEHYVKRNASDEVTLFKDGEIVDNREAPDSDDEDLDMQDLPVDSPASETLDGTAAGKVYDMLQTKKRNTRRQRRWAEAQRKRAKKLGRR